VAAAAAAAPEMGPATETAEVGVVAEVWEAVAEARAAAAGSAFSIIRRLR
jgi:hypothetical protein